MKLEQIESNERSVDHIKRIEIENLKNTPFPKTDAGKIISLLFNRQKILLDKLIRNAHYVAKEAKTLMEYVRLLNLIKQKDLI